MLYTCAQQSVGVSENVRAWLVPNRVVGGGRWQQEYDVHVYLCCAAPVN